MKKLLFIFLSLIFISPLYAQEFKLIQGFNLSSFSIEPDEYVGIGIPLWIGDYKVSFVTGLLIGGGIEFSISKSLALEIDALYFQKGSYIEVDGIPGVGWNYDLNSLSFPMLIKIKFRSGPSAYFLGGGELSLILTHEVNGTNISEDTKTFDYGLVAGGGIEIKLKNSIVCLEGRYHLGLRNITKASWFLESIKPNAIVILIGIKI